MGSPVGEIDARWRQSVSRRNAFARLAGALAGSPLLQSDLAAQTDPRPFNAAYVSSFARTCSMVSFGIDSSEKRDGRMARRLSRT